jgi:hypothetical protein
MSPWQNWFKEVVLQEEGGGFWLPPSATIHTSWLQAVRDRVAHKINTLTDPGPPDILHLNVIMKMSIA